MYYRWFRRLDVFAPDNQMLFWIHVFDLSLFKTTRFQLLCVSPRVRRLAEVMEKIILPLLCLCALVKAQAPIGTLEGQVTDPASALVANAEVTIHQAQTGLTRTVHSS